jgi:hypothetical protein
VKAESAERTARAQAEQAEKERAREARFAERRQARQAHDKACERYEGLTKAELSGQLAKRQLPESGNVDELIERLAAADSKQEVWPRSQQRGRRYREQSLLPVPASCCMSVPAQCRTRSHVALQGVTAGRARLGLGGRVLRPAVPRAA